MPKKSIRLMTRSDPVYHPPYHEMEALGGGVEKNLTVYLKSKPKD